MPYVDLNTIHNPATGTVAPAAWGDQIRENLEFLIDPPACSVYNSVNQVLSTSSFTILDCDSETYDNDSMHSTVTNNSRITVQTPGRYLLSARLNWSSSATGSRAMRYRINGVSPGATAQQLVTVPAATSGVNTQVTATWTLVLAGGDYVELEGWQNSGGNLGVRFEEFVAAFLTR